MRKKQKLRDSKLGKYLSPIMVAYIAVIATSIIETIVLAPKMTDPSIVGMVVFDTIALGLSIYAIIIIYKRNIENARNHQASGKSRKALSATGWLLLSIAMKSVIVILSYMK